MQLVLHRHDGSTVAVKGYDYGPFKGDELADVIRYLLDRYAAHESIADTPPPFATDTDRAVADVDPSADTITLCESDNTIQIRNYGQSGVDSGLRDVYTISVDALGEFARRINKGEQPVEVLANEIATILAHGVPDTFLRRIATAKPPTLVNDPGVLQWIINHLNPALPGYALMCAIADGTHTPDDAAMAWCIHNLEAWAKDNRLHMRVLDRAETHDPILSHQFQHVIMNGHVVSTRPYRNGSGLIGYDVREALLAIAHVREAWWWQSADRNGSFTGTRMWRLDRMAQRLLGEHDVLFWLIQPALGPLMVQSSREGFPTGGTELGDTVRFWHEPTGVYQPEGRLLGAVLASPTANHNHLDPSDCALLRQRITETVTHEAGLTGPDTGRQYEIHLPLGDRYLTFCPKPNHRQPPNETDLLNWSFKAHLPAPNPYTEPHGDPANEWATQIRNACVNLTDNQRIPQGSKLHMAGPYLDGLTDTQRAQFETWCMHHNHSHRPIIRV